MTETAVIGVLVGRDRRSGRPALYAAGRDRTYSYFDLCNTAAKAGNVLRHVGVRPSDTVWIEARPDPEPFLTFLGAAQLGATTRFVGPHDAGDAVLGDSNPPSAVVVHAAAESALSVEPATSVVVYGGEPERTDATHWETEVWSENPAAPPAPVAPDDDALVTPDETYTHRAVLDAARTARDHAEIDGDTTVVVRASLTDPRAVAGSLTALLADGTVALPTGDEPVDRDRTVVIGDDGHDTERLALDAISL